MARPRKPASMQTRADRNHNRAELDAMEEEEEKLRGSSDRIDKVPPHLSELAKQYYRTITNEMRISGVLSNLDIPLVSLTAETLAIIRDAEKMINEEGIMSGGKPHPAINIRDKNLTQARSLLIQLGMTPSSRASLAVDNLKQKEEDEDDLLKILRGS